MKTISKSLIVNHVLIYRPQKIAPESWICARVTLFNSLSFI